MHLPNFLAPRQGSRPNSTSLTNCILTWTYGKNYSLHPNASERGHYPAGLLPHPSIEYKIRKVLRTKYETMLLSA